MATSKESIKYGGAFKRKNALFEPFPKCLILRASCAFLAGFCASRSAPLSGAGALNNFFRELPVRANRTLKTVY